jgi:hypothetical protein
MLDPWQGDIPLILTESRSLAGVLRATCRDYRVRIASTNGQVNGFLRTKVVSYLSRFAIVRYLGDWDFSGGHIEANTRGVLEVGRLDWVHLALTEEQVETYNLVIIDKYDGRTKSTHQAVDTEALSQTVLVDLVRTALDDLLPEPLDDVRVREQREQETIRRLLS